MIPQRGDEMIEHDKSCRGCDRRRGMPIWADIARCSRSGCDWRGSGSYLHQVEGKSYCGKCADIMARARNEALCPLIMCAA